MGHDRGCWANGDPEIHERGRNPGFVLISASSRLTQQGNFVAILYGCSVDPVHSKLGAAS